MTEQDTEAERHDEALFLAKLRYKLAAALQLRLLDSFNSQRIAMSPQTIAQEAVHHADCLLEALGMTEAAKEPDLPEECRG